MDSSELDRGDIAFLSAGHDEELLDYLEKNGYSRDKIRTLILSLRDRFRSNDLNCHGIKHELNRHFKKRPKVQRVVKNYRRQLQEWVNDSSNYPNPPQLDLQQLPPLTSQTLNKYLAYFEDKYITFFSNFNSKYDPLSINPENMESKLDLEDKYKGYSIANCEHLIKEFIETSEENALQFLLHAFDLNDSRLIASYEDLIEAALQKLVNNIHFLRSLFNLLDDNFHKQDTIKKIDVIILNIVLNELVKLGVCTTFSDSETEVDLSSPRPDQCYTFGFDLVGEGSTPAYWKERNKMNLRISQQLLPAHWNGHRLVNPKLNDSFKEFANVLNAVEFHEEKKNAGEIHLNGFVHDRRYASDFTRVKVTDIQGMEDMDLRFHYFNHSHLRSGEIGVEVVVNGASTVFFLDEEGKLTVRESGNLNPPLPANIQVTDDHVDTFAVNPLKWLTEKGLTNLYLYILKYAHHLFVQPRTKTKNNNSGSGRRRNNRFNIRLSEYSSEITIPSTSQGGQTEGGSRRITVYHGVTGHIRDLPAGWKPSQEAIDEARRHNIFLAPGQTFVKPHHRGSELAEETDSKKKLSDT